MLLGLTAEHSANPAVSPNFTIAARCHFDSWNIRIPDKPETAQPNKDKITAAISDTAKDVPLLCLYCEGTRWDIASSKSNIVLSNSIELKNSNQNVHKKNIIHNPLSSFVDFQ